MTSVFAGEGNAPRERSLPRRLPRRGLRAKYPVVQLIAYRLFMGAVLLFGVSALSFFLLSLTPGDAARQILGLNGTPAQYAQLRNALGLDRPLYDQYWTWLVHALSGNLGVSLLNGGTVTQEIQSAAPVTMSLIAGSVVVSVVLGVLFGVFSAVRGGVLGKAVDAFALVGWALPVFWVASELVAVFAVWLHILPAVGYVPFSQSPSQWAQSLTLPVVALSLGPVAAIAKQTREAMLDVLASEHIRMAAANGVPPRSLIFRHALRNSATRVVTVLGIQIVGLLGGTVLVEGVFALPGLGSLVVTASVSHDIPVVQGVAVYFTLVVVVVNFVVDLVSWWLNPKVRLS